MFHQFLLLFKAYSIRFLFGKKKCIEKLHEKYNKFNIIMILKHDAKVLSEYGFWEKMNLNEEFVCKAKIKIFMEIYPYKENSTNSYVQ